MYQAGHSVMKAADLQAGNPLRTFVLVLGFRHLGQSLTELVNKKPTEDVEHTIYSSTIRATFSLICRFCTLSFPFLP